MQAINSAVRLLLPLPAPARTGGEASGSKTYSRRRDPIRLLHHAYSIWLFTRSDIKTIIAPSTAFAVLCLLSQPAPNGQSPPVPWLQVASRIPSIVVWVWINLLPFSINNQSSAAAVAEDAANKAWRPLPSKRLSLQSARRLMVAIYAAAVVVSGSVLGGSTQCLLLILLGCWYNNLGGADTSFVVRNFINACGYMSFNAGALAVGLAGGSQGPGPFAAWVLLTGCVVQTTIQIQDFEDAAGDAQRGRRTMPLVVGDGPARVWTACALTLWTALCAWYWRVPAAAWAAFGALNVLVGGRLLWLRTTAADRTTFRLWNGWMLMLYALPLWARWR